MSNDNLNIPKIIREHTIQCGGVLSVDDLVDDFKTAYKYDIPYEDLGYPSLESFLTSIPNIKLQDIEGRLYLHSTSRRKSYSGASKSSNDDITEISSKITNDLRIQNEPIKKTVTVNCPESSNMFCRKLVFNRMNDFTNSENNESNSEYNSSINSECVNSKESYHSQLYEDWSSGSSLEPCIRTPEGSIFDCDSYGYDETLSTQPPLANSLSTSSLSLSTNSLNNYKTPLTTLNMGSLSLSTNSLNNYKTNQYYYLLMELISYHNLEEPEFETLDKYSFNEIKFTTILKVGSENFISPLYSNLSSSNEIYEELLKTAYETLKKRMEKRFENKLDFTSIMIEVINNFKEKVDTEIIKTAYIKKYGVCPPQNWINLIADSLLIYIEKYPTITYMYPKRNFESVPRSTDLPQKFLPTTNTWDVLITNCVNSKSIWFRILGGDYGVMFQNLYTALQKHYENQTTSNLQTTEIGALYACLYEGHWCRVEVLNKKEYAAECFMLENGTIRTLYFHTLFPLDQKFTNTPPIAFCGSMYSLEAYDQVKYVTCNLNKMLQNEVVSVQLISSSPNFSINVYLKNSELKFSVNSYIMNKIVSDFQPPKMTEVDMIFDIYLLSIEESGQARIQIESDSLQLLKKSLQRVSQIMDRDEGKRNFYVSSLLNIKLDKVYLLKDGGVLERVKIKKIINGTRVVALCIDTGEVKNVEMKNIIYDETFPDTLTNIIPQMCEVRLTPNNLTTKMIRFLHLDCSQNNSSPLKLTMKVINPTQCPLVELYKRIPNRGNVPLKDLLIDNSDQIIGLNFLNNLINVIPKEVHSGLFGEAENIVNSNSLPLYKFSQGTVLKTSIHKIFNPFCFTVKMEEQSSFSDLMVDMNNYHFIRLLEPEYNIVIGGCYAVKLENGFWYRGLALFVMQDLKTVIIQLIDFAEIVSVTLTSVYPLTSQFRSLPAQTMTARLWGIKPIKGEWTTNDISRFKELVCSKVLECVIVDVKDSFLRVILLDHLSTAQAVNISTLLLTERRAVSFEG